MNTTICQACAAGLGSEKPRGLPTIDWSINKVRMFGKLQKSFQGFQYEDTLVARVHDALHDVIDLYSYHTARAQDPTF